MNLTERHWTVIANGPSHIKLLLCTHKDCGLLDSFLRYDDALEEAKAHSAENGR